MNSTVAKGYLIALNKAILTGNEFQIAHISNLTAMSFPEWADMDRKYLNSIIEMGRKQDPELDRTKKMFESDLKEFLKSQLYRNVV